MTPLRSDNIATASHNIEGLFVGAAGFYKGVATSQLDELAAETAAAMTASHPDYASLARRWWWARRRRSDCGFGDTVTRLETAVYEAVRDRFRGVRRVAGGGRGGAVRHALRSESAGESDRADIGLGFRWGKSVRLPARNYLVLKVPPINMSIILK
ncbi:hypothetical protein Syun_012691 [Stephania yunnanensis]|uniref:Uncharacterized protein n=1 Tax=Stephania yunnanensis TaxID=152371 RepID=A0AAP0PJP8_9MAGN